jgi:hypothetical protein
MDMLLIRNILYLDLLEAIYKKRASGAEIPAKLIQEIKEFGREAGVPEEQLNVLEYIGHEVDPIH